MGGPCSLESAMLSVSRLHNLVAFSTLCTHDVNLLLLVPSNILIEFNVGCCSACVWRPKIWLCKNLIKSELLGDCVVTVFTWLLLVLGVFLTGQGELCWLLMWWWVLLQFLLEWKWVSDLWDCWLYLCNRDDCWLYWWYWLPLEQGLPLMLCSGL